MNQQSKALLIKGVGSLSLIAAILTTIDLGAFWGVIRVVDVWLFVFSCCLFVIQQVLMALSWGVLVRAKQSQLRYRHVVYAHMVGNFFGTWLPSTLGIDAVRAYVLSRYMNERVDAASSMFVVRAVGFLVLLFLALIFVIPLVKITGERGIFWSLSVSFAVFIVTVGLAFSRRSYSLLENSLRFIRLGGVAKQIQLFRQSLVEFSRRHLALVSLFLLTFGYQILGIVVVFVIGMALDISTPLNYYFIFIPAISVLTLIPISVAGVGVREGSFVYLFSSIGVQPEKALSLSLLMFSQAVLLALAGGVIYLTRKTNRRQSMSRIGDSERASETVKEEIGV